MKNIWIIIAVIGFVVFAAGFILLGLITLFMNIPATFDTRWWLFTRLMVPGIFVGFICESRFEYLKEKEKNLQLNEMPSSFQIPIIKMLATTKIRRELVIITLASAVLAGFSFSGPRLSGKNLDEIRLEIAKIDGAKHSDYYKVNAVHPEKSTPVERKTFTRGDLTMVAFIDAKHKYFAIVESDEGHAGLYGYIYSESNLIEETGNKDSYELLPPEAKLFNVIKISDYKNWYKGIDDLE